MRNFPRTDGRAGRSAAACWKYTFAHGDKQTRKRRDAISPQQQQRRRRRLSAMSNQCNCALRARRAPTGIFINAPVHADCTSTRRVSRLHTRESCYQRASGCMTSSRVHIQQRMCVTLRWLLLDLANADCGEKILRLFASRLLRFLRRT